MTSKRQSGGGPSSGGLSGSRRPVATTAAATALILAGCSAGGGGPAPTDQADSDRATGPVHVVTHDSFALSVELLEAFQAETGHELQFSAPRSEERRVGK